MTGTTLVEVYVTKQNERLDQIAARRYGSSANDVVIHVMNANPGIERYGIILPPGIKIKLPDLPKSATTTTVRENKTLWS
ncbi:tail protein X [Methylobacterium sp. B1]|uniref:tail protein X n=1 Tax=Methylobacterium sp. B1 TaxID=91459 RepID=UPI000345865B|nr:tail protein X [Methylobacterium sp. B1]